MTTMATLEDITAESSEEAEFASRKKSKKQENYERL